MTKDFNARVYLQQNNEVRTLSTQGSAGGTTTKTVPRGDRWSVSSSGPAPRRDPPAQVAAVSQNPHVWISDNPDSLMYSLDRNYGADPTRVSPRTRFICGFRTVQSRAAGVR